MPRTIYISLPITGQEDTWQERERNLLAKVRRSFPADLIIAPGDINPVGCGKSYATCMADCVQVLLDPSTTHVVLARDWETSGSRGCRLEHEVAIIFNKQCIYEQADGLLQIGMVE